MTKQAEIDYPLKVEPSLLYEKPYYDATALREFGVALSVLKKWLPSGCKLLDLGCGPGWSSLFLTRAGWKVLGLDISQRMIEIARERTPGAAFVLADALPLPFDDASFDRVFTGHFYGHLDAGEREAFVAEARRVAPELIVVDSAVRPDHAREEVQERILNDGSAFQVYKRYFNGAELACELGGGTVVHEDDWFVMVAAGQGR